MAKDLISKRIDGRNYQFSQLGAKESLRLLTKLIKILGEPMAMGFAAMAGKKKDEKSKKGVTAKSILDNQMDGDLIGKAMRALCDRLDEDVVLEIIEQLTANHVLCDGAQIIFHTHYEGKLGVMFKVLYAALEVQYGDFFSVISESKGSLKTAMTQAQPT